MSDASAADTPLPEKPEKAEKPEKEETALEEAARAMQDQLLQSQERNSALLTRKRFAVALRGQA